MDLYSHVRKQIGIIWEKKIFYDTAISKQGIQPKKTQNKFTLRYIIVKFKDDQRKTKVLT